MANTSSAKKAIRSSERKKIINLRTKRAFKEASKAVGAKGSSADALTKAFKAIDKAAKANVIHRNTAARYKSKLAKKAN